MRSASSTPALWIGCCGWPEGRSRYFQHFPAVELQTTFYQPPAVALAEKWRREAPAEFAFTLKAWQLITHPASSPTYRRLKNRVEPGKADQYGYFRPTEEVWAAWRATSAVAQALRAHAIVFQCPASFAPTEENKKNLATFFRAIERGPWLAVWEPRGQWESPEIRDLSRRLDLIHCVDPFSAEPLHGKAVYFRLHGRGAYRYQYSDPDLRHLQQICARYLAAGRAPIWVMFNNTFMRDDALRFRDLMAAG
jgi:uncharacterized protein YecE (DUF72 family)